LLDPSLSGFGPIAAVDGNVCTHGADAWTYRKQHPEEQAFSTMQ
jgi:hypothetical protein